jgi:hypothetical protein
MKRVLPTALVGLVSCLGIGLALTLTIRTAEAQSPAAGTRDVIMMRCSASSKSFEVGAYHGSPAAPGPKSINCPEQLSLLVKAGFKINDIGYFDLDADFIVYTLTR